MRKIAVSVITAGIIAVSSIFPATAFAGETAEFGEEKRTVSVSASSSVMALPDMAEITVGIQEEGKVADEVQETVAKKVDAVKTALLANEVEEKDISVTGYNIYPIRDYDSDSVDYNRITGYDVSVAIIVSNQDAEKAGGIITECVKAGANDVEDVVYTCSNYEELYEQALEEAVKKAKRKAEVVAGAEGEKINRIVTISEGYENTEYRYSNSGYAKGSLYEASAMNSDGYEMDLSPKEAEITASVNAVYEITEESQEKQDADSGKLSTNNS